MLILTILVFGMFAGWLAQIILGRRSYRVNWQLALGSGFLGSFVGGMLASFLSGDGLQIAPAGLIGSTIGAIIVTVAYQYWERRRQQA